MDHNLCQPLHLWEKFFEITKMAYAFMERGTMIVASDGHRLFFYEQVGGLTYCINHGFSL